MKDALKRSEEAQQAFQSAEALVISCFGEDSYDVFCSYGLPFFAFHLGKFGVRTHWFAYNHSGWHRLVQKSTDSCSKQCSFAWFFLHFWAGGFLSFIFVGVVICRVFRFPQIRKEIFALPTGGRWLCEGGWRGDAGGHALMRHGI